MIGVKAFFAISCTGGSNKVSERKSRLINSSAADAVYLTSGGKIFRGKDISLVLSLKSMTGNKAVVNVLNRFGHCVSNEKVRQTDSRMEAFVTLTKKLRPNNIRKYSKACIGLPWDNFDIDLETLFRAESIHYAYGICHQNISIDEEEGVAVCNSSDANKEYTEQFASVTVNNRKWKITEIPNNISKDSLNNI